MTQIINSHNRKVKQPKKEESLSCNCRQKNDCPMDGKCRTMNTVYKRIASVPTKPDKSYIGLSEDEWKKPYYNHRKSFWNQRYQSETMLSSYVWETCYRLNMIPEMVNHYSSTSLLKYHETLSTLFTRRTCHHYISRSWKSVKQTFQNYVKMPPPTKVFIE